MALELHMPKSFVKGQRVKVDHIVKEALAWHCSYNDGMDKLVGEVGTVLGDDDLMGIHLNFTSISVAWWFPSCALALVQEEAVQTPVLPAQKPVSQKKAKPRTTPSKQPWDTAPCTHLRWHLMGFLKEKLTIRISQVYRDGNMQEATRQKDAAMVEFACVKCNTKMSMLAEGA